LAALLLVTGLTAACTAADPGWPPDNRNFDLVPVPVSTEIVVGSNRLLFNILDKQNQSVASPDRPVHLRFFNLAASRTQPANETDAIYMTTAPGRPGLYRAESTFDVAGDWGVEAVATESGGSKRTGRFVFSVRESGTTPAIGADAVSVETPTASTEDEIAAISTDDDPDPDFYRQSVSAALAAHEPFALVFATPAFCTSATCGPTLDLVKSVAAPFKASMGFIHVEPYELEQTDSGLRPVLDGDNLPLSVDATIEYGLPTEPYIFVVNRDGKVSAKFEGIASQEELAAAFTAVATPAT
jgi:hypothetical protein